MDFPPPPTQFTSNAEATLGIPLLAVTYPGVDEMLQTPEFQIHELRGKVDALTRGQTQLVHEWTQLSARVYDLEHPWRRRWRRFRTWLSQTF